MVELLDLDAFLKQASRVFLPRRAIWGRAFLHFHVMQPASLPLSRTQHKP